MCVVSRIKKKTMLTASYKERSKKVAFERKVRAVLRRASRIAMVVSLVVCFATAIYGYKQQWHHHYAQKWGNALLQLTAKQGLMLEMVFVEGLHHLDEGYIRALLPQKEVPLLSLDLPKIRHSIEQMGWVETADIQRVYPNRLHIDVKERVARAIWQYDGNLHLIDASGEVISLDVSRFSHLPVLVGEDANLYASSLLTFLTEEPDLMERIASVIRVGGRRWNVRFKNGVEVKLPENQPDIRWRALSSLHRTSRILDRKVDYIDMRNEHRIYVAAQDNHTI